MAVEWVEEYFSWYRLLSVPRWSSRQSIYNLLRSSLSGLSSEMWWSKWHRRFPFGDDWCLCTLYSHEVHQRAEVIQTPCRWTWLPGCYVDAVHLSEENRSLVWANRASFELLSVSTCRPSSLPGMRPPWGTCTFLEQEASTRACIIRAYRQDAAAADLLLADVDWAYHAVDNSWTWKYCRWQCCDTRTPLLMSRLRPSR